jgi:RimJ/RimL family protein N-acetyltransferase
MGLLEYIPATRHVLRHLSSDPEDFAQEHGIRLHELSRSIAQHSLEFMRTFSLETPAMWFGYLVVEGASQQMVGTCSYKGPPDGGAIEIAFFTFPGFEGRGMGTAMAQFLVEQATRLPGVKTVIAHTTPGSSASTRILEKAGLTLAGPALEDGQEVWRWRRDLEE